MRTKHNTKYSTKYSTIPIIGTMPRIILGIQKYVLTLTSTRYSYSQYCTYLFLPRGGAGVGSSALWCSSCTRHFPGAFLRSLKARCTTYGSCEWAKTTGCLSGQSA